MAKDLPTMLAGYHAATDSSVAIELVWDEESYIAFPFTSPEDDKILKATGINLDDFHKRAVFATQMFETMKEAGWKWTPISSD